jgi:hypothetical protein
MAKRERNRMQNIYESASQDPEAAEKAYHSIVDPLERDFIGQLKATLQSDVNSREIAERFGSLIFEVREPRVRNPPA